MLDKIQLKLYELWHGHPFLINEEVNIILKTRDDPKYKHLTESQVQELIKIRVQEMYKQYKKRKNEKRK